MAFSDIPTFNPGDNSGLQRWALDHYLEHQQFNSTIEGLGGTIPGCPLQQLDPKYPQNWLIAHQRSHESYWNALGANVGANLAQLNFDDPEEVSDWLNVHETIHYDIRTTLGL